MVAMNDLLNLQGGNLAEQLVRDEQLEDLVAKIISSPMAAIFTARDYYQGWGAE